MQNTATVRVSDCFANIDKRSEKPSILAVLGIFGLGAFLFVKRADCLVEAVAFDETHHVIRISILVGSQTIDRYDAWMFEFSGDFRFAPKTFLMLTIFGVRFPNLFKCDFSIQFPVLCNEDFANPALGVRFYNLKSV